MDFLPDEINDYAISHTSKECNLLYELNRKTNTNVLLPRMLSGHLQGRLLSMFSKMISPKRILEIGTYTGYSAICMAEGLVDDAKLFTIDINDELEDFVRSFFNKSAYSNKIEFIIGNALNVITTLNESWDLVFIDADKENYCAYYELIIDNINSGGYLIADNVLWSGKVLDLNKNNDDETQGIHKFNNLINNDSRVENILLPVRDGLMIVRKK